MPYLNNKKISMVMGYAPADIISETQPIKAGEILIGSHEPSEEGQIAGSGISVFDIVNRKDFQHGKTGDILMINSQDEETGDVIVVNSGVNLFEGNEPVYIVSGEIAEAVEEINISADKDGNPFTLKDRITVYIGTPKADAKGNLTVKLDGDSVGICFNALNTSASFSRCTLVWNGCRWENYSVSAATATGTANGQVNSVVKYLAAQKNPTSIQITGDIPAGTTFSVYAYRA